MARGAQRWQGKVMTVEGPIPAEELGVTMPHEHLVVRGWDYRERNYFNSAYMELVQYPVAGGTTLVDLTTVGRDRDPAFMRRLATKSGVKLVLGTGYYKHESLPQQVHAMSVEDMARAMVTDLMEGIGGSGIRAGVIGELGVSRPITRTEEKVLQAAAAAHRETGAGIVVHFDVGSKEGEYHHALDLLEEGGADLRRVAVSHLVPRPDNLELCQGLAGRGCFIGLDLFGQESWPLKRDLIDTHPEVQIASVRGFADNGLLEHLLLSQNVSHMLHMTVNGGNGYAHVLLDVVPKLKGYGTSEEELHTILVDNPRRLLAVPR